MGQKIKSICTRSIVQYKRKSATICLSCLCLLCFVFLFSALLAVFAILSFFPGLFSIFTTTSAGCHKMYFYVLMFIFLFRFVIVFIGDKVMTRGCKLKRVFRDFQQHLLVLPNCICICVSMYLYLFSIHICICIYW